MDVAGTDSGNPAARTALRPTFTACSPTCITQPMMTSSTMAGSRPLRSTSALSGSAARSTACHPRSLPLRLPPGVRTASTITAVVIGGSPFKTDRVVKNLYWRSYRESLRGATPRGYVGFGPQA